MPCYHPITVKRGVKGLAFSMREAVRDLRKPTTFKSITVSCGKCIGCLVRRAREYAVRCAHEARLYRRSLFVTLTYNDDFLPSDGQLVRAHVQKFIKDLRYRLAKKNRRFRIFYCGEYGPKNNRPHYHLILFGCEPGDLRIGRSLDAKHPYYKSDIIKDCWKRGYIDIQDVNYRTCAYVSRYVTKKALDKDSCFVVPPFCQGSTRPGLGFTYLFSNPRRITRLFTQLDVTVIQDMETKHFFPPRYYLKKFKELFPEKELSLRRRILSFINEKTAHIDNMSDFLYNQEQLMLSRESKKMLRRTL